MISITFEEAYEALKNAGIPKTAITVPPAKVIVDNVVENSTESIFFGVQMARLAFDYALKDEV